MNDASEIRLADRVHRELRQLPDHRAPATLAPRVMAALAAQRRMPWWKKSWAAWPPGMRAIFLTVSLAMAGGLILAGLQLPQLNEVAFGIETTTTGWLLEMKPYLAVILRLGDALWLGVRAAPPHILWSVVALIGLAYATCVGLGTLGYRMALNRI